MLATRCLLTETKSERDARFSQSSNHVHAWCYAHVLTVAESDSLFTLLDNIAAFRQSCKRMNLWWNESQNKRHRRSNTVGETWWWAKQEALKIFFGFFCNADNALFINVVLALSAIEEDDTMKSPVSVKARSSIEDLLRYKTILTAQLFLRIFVCNICKQKEWTSSRPMQWL